jgi:hypothetical protein
MSLQFNKKRFCRKKDKKSLSKVLFERSCNGLFGLTCRFYSICRDNFFGIVHDLPFFFGVGNNGILFPYNQIVDYLRL